MNFISKKKEGKELFKRLALFIIILLSLSGQIWAEPGPGPGAPIGGLSNTFTGSFFDFNSSVRLRNHLGPELVTNGTFTGAATGWTLGTGWAYSANTVVKNGDGTGTLSPTTALTITANSIYRVAYVVSSMTVSSVTASIGGVTLPVQSDDDSATVFYVTASSTANLVFTPTNTSRFTIDNVSVKKVGTAGTDTVVLFEDDRDSAAGGGSLFSLGESGGHSIRIGNTGIGLGDSAQVNHQNAGAANYEYGVLGKINSGAGGLNISGYTDADGTALALNCLVGSEDPTDTTPSCKIVASKKSGSSSQALGASETVLQFLNYTTELFTQTGDGSYRQPASTYHNFGATIGTSGYGFFDDAGTIKFKNSGGNWAEIIGSITTANPGAELTTNGTFTGAATGWTLGTGWAYSANTVVKNGDGVGTLSQTITVATNDIIEITFTVATMTVGDLVSVTLGTVTEDVNIDSTGTDNLIYKVYFISTSSNGALAFTPSNLSRFTIDNVSAKKVGTKTSNSVNLWATDFGINATSSPGLNLLGEFRVTSSSDNGVARIAINQISTTPLVNSVPVIDFERDGIRIANVGIDIWSMELGMYTGVGMATHDSIGIGLPPTYNIWMGEPNSQNINGASQPNFMFSQTPGHIGANSAFDILAYEGQTGPFMRVRGTQTTTGLQYTGFAVYPNSTAVGSSSGTGAGTEPAYRLGVSGEVNIANGYTLVINGADFSGTIADNWTAGNAAVLTAVAGGQAGNCLEVKNAPVIGTNGQAIQAITTVIGKEYRFTGYYKNGTIATMLLGVGTTSGGVEYLTSGVVGNAAWTQYTGTFVATATTAYVLLYNTGGNPDETVLFDTVSLVEVGNLYVAERIGVGTVTPDELVEIYGGSSTAKIKIGSSSSYMEVAGGTGSYDYINSPSWGLALQTGGNSRIYIASTGNIGAGTSGPIYTFDTAGAINSRIYYHVEEFDEEVATTQFESGKRASEWVTAGTNYAAGNVTYTAGPGGTLKAMCANADNDSVTSLGILNYNTTNNPVMEVRVKIDTKETAAFYAGFASAAFADVNGAFPNDAFLVGINSDNGHTFGATQIVAASVDNGAAVDYDDMGVAIVSDTYVKIKIDLTDTEQPRVWINDTEVAAGSISGTVQAGVALAPYFMVQNLAGGAIQRFITLDYFKMWQDR